MRDYSSAGARFDATERYRYSLWRVWDPLRPVLLWILCNPSTADGDRDDPTTRRCVAFAHMWGLGAIEIVNLFAIRSSSPRGLGVLSDPVGPDNDVAIACALERCRTVVAGWGDHGLVGRREEQVRQMIAHADVVCLGRTRRGAPRHPLYVASTRPPTGFRPIGPTLTPPGASSR